MKHIIRPLIGILCLLLLPVSFLHAQPVEFRDSMGYLENEDAVVIGWVTNRSSEAREYVRIQVQIQNEQGETLGRDFGFTLLERLLPGESSPFSLRVGDVPTFRRYRLELESRITEEPPPRDVRVVKASGLMENESFRVTGEVKNSGDSPAKNVQISCAGFRQREGSRSIAGVGFTYVPKKRLNPDESASFELVIPDPPRQIEHYTLQVQAEYLPAE